MDVLILFEYSLGLEYSGIGSLILSEAVQTTMRD